jgi:hypothetical protein
MHKLLRWTLALALTASAAGWGASAAKSGLERSAPAAATADDEALALLPAANLIAVADGGRVFNELLPKLKSITTGNLAKSAQEVEDFINQAGIDKARIRSVVFAGRLEGQTGSGVAIAPGLTFDAARIEAAVKARNGQFRAEDYRGRTIYLVTLGAKTPGASVAGLSLQIGNELAFAQLNAAAVVGDPSSVKSVLDAQTGSGQRGANAALLAALKETKPTGLLRFAGTLPANLRQELAQMGDLFTQLAAVKVIFGAFDLAADSSATLDARFRTGSKDEASQLELSLKSLIFLGKSFLGGNQQPLMQALDQMLDQIKIAAETNDVALSITLPRSMIDLLSTPEKKAETASNPAKP